MHAATLYRLGREGYDYNDVCPQSMTLDLLKAHDEGYLNYQREQRLNRLRELQRTKTHFGAHPSTVVVLVVGAV
ncbi:MAG: hypothetical protein U1E91_02130 [Moraxella sp.]